MSDSFKYTNKFRLHKNDSLMRSSKRPRQSLVCNQCRATKLRCDRGQPCSSCIKRDYVTVCSYTQDAKSDSGTNYQAVAEDRLNHLTTLVEQFAQGQASTKSSGELLAATSGPGENISAATSITLDQIPQTQNAYKSYVGSTHWSAIMDDINDLKLILQNTAEVEDSGESNGIVLSNIDGDPIFGSLDQYSLDHIVSNLLPSRVEIDRFLSTYFRGETFIIPFIHTYQFQSQYRDFWTNPMSVNPLWLSILFSICHIASIVGTKKAPDASTRACLNIQPPTLHVVAGQCLVLGDYRRPQQYAPEALTIYAQCKNLQCLDPSREAGAVLSIAIRMAHEMGYHRDPDTFGGFSTFEAEMRRRCWAVCKQMDLMMSFQLGLPSNVCLENCDTRSPRNLLDSDINEDTRILPLSRSESEATNLLWFIIKDRQMPSFGKVCRDVLSFQEKSESEIHLLDQEIRQTQATIPSILRTRPMCESIADPPFLIITRIYINFISLKSLCVLHRRSMGRGNSPSTKSCTEAGRQLVEQFIDMYKEFAFGGQLYAERWMLTSFTMNDFLLGVMVLCLAIHIHWRRNSPTMSPATEQELLLLLEQSYSICVENSTSSRDARRVGYAIRITLRRVGEHSPNTVPAAAWFNTKNPSKNVNQHEQATDAGDIGTLRPLHDLGSREGEAAFGLLDPFNFASNEFVDNFDWDAFGSQFTT